MKTEEDEDFRYRAWKGKVLTHTVCSASQHSVYICNGVFCMLY